jgi:hypothetical protein
MRFTGEKGSEMSNGNRRVCDIAVLGLGGLLASGLIALLTSPQATADPTSDVASTTGDVVTLGPYSIDGYTETLSYNDSTDAVDNYLTGTYDGSAFDLDTYFGAPGSNSFEVLLTDPGVFQLGLDDVGGSVSYIDNFFGIDFVGTDPGLGDLGGITADVVGALGL